MAFTSHLRVEFEFASRVHNHDDMAAAGALAPVGGLGDAPIAGMGVRAAQPGHIAVGICWEFDILECFHGEV